MMPLDNSERKFAMLRNLVFSFVLFLITSSPAFSASYKLDTSHTNVIFKIKHLVFATVTGRFDKFEGIFDFNEKTGEISKLDVKIDANSINTNEADRDKHLRSKDFFNVEKYAQIRFKSSKSQVKSKKPVDLRGELSMVGKKKPLTFDIDYKGTATDPWGNERLIFEATTTLNRKDFGMNWNKSLDKGGVMIGEEVKVIVEAQGIKQE